MGEIEESLLLNFETQNLKHRIIASVFDGGTNICDFLRHHFLHFGQGKRAPQTLLDTSRCLSFHRRDKQCGGHESQRVGQHQPDFQKLG